MSTSRIGRRYAPAATHPQQGNNSNAGTGHGPPRRPRKSTRARLPVGAVAHDDTIDFAGRRPGPVEARKLLQLPRLIEARAPRPPPSRSCHGLHTAPPGPVTGITPRRAQLSHPVPAGLCRPRPARSTAYRGLQEECRGMCPGVPSLSRAAAPATSGLPPATHMTSHPV